MSDIPADWRGQLDLWAELARIDRDRVETRTLQEESEKFIAEQRTLIAEGQKLDRDRWLAPWSLLIALMGRRSPSRPAPRSLSRLVALTGVSKQPDAGSALVHRRGGAME